MFTPAQKTTFKADRAANTATIQATVQGQSSLQTVAIKDVTDLADNYLAISAWYNQLAAPDYFVWRKDVPVVDILDKVTFVNYTPNDSATETLIDGNRAMRCQIKQGNITLLFQNRSAFDSTKVNLRSALNDATTNLPSGAAGVSRSGGWSNILPILSRKTLNVEKLFVVDDGVGIGNTTTDPRGANTNPDMAVFEGTISENDVRDSILNG